MANSFFEYSFLIQNASRRRPLWQPAIRRSRICGMSYNSARDELFLADNDNKVVRAMRVRDNAGDLRDVYRATLHDKSPFVWSVCHMSDSDTLLVCSGEFGPDGK